MCRKKIICLLICGKKKLYAFHTMEKLMVDMNSFNAVQKSIHCC